MWVNPARSGRKQLKPAAFGSSLHKKMKGKPVTYRVLARRYRPQRLADVLGQESMVQALDHAIRHNRLPHAFLLNGIRGVGKTTTARILAKGLNCSEGITVEPCGKCPSCLALTEDKHVDVLEMDAASHTGVDDVREITESLRYKPAMGRFKIFIIDEAHMLSKSAFNALLKTLEEPPDHVKFILATTELRKIPDTIISRCMRIDLKRFDVASIAKHLTHVVQLEGGTISEDAARILGRAADGSMRDGLSLLDQAIHICMGQDNSFHIELASVQDMLGQVGEDKVYILFSYIFEAQTQEALVSAQECLKQGADPILMAEDMLEALYFITLGINSAQIVPLAARELADKAKMPYLVRSWQMLLQGYEELQKSPHPSQAFEMLVLRLCYVSPLPTAGEIAEHLGLPSAEQQKRLFQALVEPIIKSYPHVKMDVNQGE